MMVNDEPQEAAGRLSLALDRESGECVARAEAGFHLAALGQETYRLDLHVPEVHGKFLLKAAAQREPAGEPPTVSRRKIEIK
jgi:hypothetical protein